MKTIRLNKLEIIDGPASRRSVKWGSSRLIPDSLPFAVEGEGKTDISSSKVEKPGHKLPPKFAMLPPDSDKHYGTIVDHSWVHAADSNPREKFSFPAGRS